MKMENILQTIISRRATLQSSIAATMAAISYPKRSLCAPSVRSRVIVDNDFCGDPDGLFQLAHQILSPSCHISTIIGSHLHKGENWSSDRGPRNQATESVRRARDLIGIIDSNLKIPLHEGSAGPLACGAKITPNGATRAIIDEAMRADVPDIPLYYAAGASLTELAKAIILEPRIATRMTLVWIGGNEYPSEHFEQPTASKPEYNMTIDLDSCRYIFNNCNIPIWQVPRNTYRRMLISYSELCNIGRTCGTLGKFLLQSINDVADLAVRTGKLKNGIGETYILGDSPLVTLTALQSSFDPDTSSSNFAIKRAPKIDSCGNYTHNEEGRAIRIYSEIDSRLTFEDMKTKFFSHAKYL